MRTELRRLFLRLLARLPVPLSAIPSLPPADAPLRILVIRPDHLGDLLFTTPALRQLRAAFPQAHITALVGPWGKAVLQDNPHLDEIHTCPFPGFTRRPKPSPWQPYLLAWRTARQLRRQGYDLALVLRFDHWWGAMVAFLAGIPCRVGYDIPEVAPFLTDAVTYIPGRHEVLQNLRLMEYMVNGRLVAGRLVGYQSPNLPVSQSSREQHALEFHFSDKDEDFATRFLRERGVAEGELVVCMHPGAGAPVKLWREEAWAAVGDGLIERYGGRIVLTGGPGEEELCRTIAAQMAARPVIAAGQTTLAQLAALFAHSRLVLGVDSGPLHLAVAVGTPTVHLFGPADPCLFGPWGDPARHVIIASDMPCAPCGRLDYPLEELPAHPCVREIPVERVLAAAVALLQRPTP